MSGFAHWVVSIGMSATLAAQDVPASTAADPRQAAPPAARTGANAPGEPDPIIVMAPRLPAPGYWRFDIMRTTIEATPTRSSPPASWGQCIRSDATETTLQQIIGKDVGYSGSGVCSFRKLTIADGRIAGERRCLSQRGRSTTRIDGSYDADQVRYRQQTEQVNLMRDPAGGSMDSESVSLVTGTRVGECRKK